MTSRSTNEILKDITLLFTELSEAQASEREWMEAEICKLNTQLDQQKQKNKDIAHILLNDDYEY